MQVVFGLRFLSQCKWSFSGYLHSCSVFLRHYTLLSWLFSQVFPNSSKVWSIGRLETPLHVSLDLCFCFLSPHLLFQIGTQEICSLSLMISPVQLLSVLRLCEEKSSDRSIFFSDNLLSFTLKGPKRFTPVFLIGLLKAILASGRSVILKCSFF